MSQAKVVHRVPKAPAALAALLLAAVLLSGCSGDAPAPDPALGADGAPLASTLPQPTWAVGDWWSYLVDVGPGEEGAPTTYVITADKGSDWWMDTDSPDRAFQDARDDISRLGPQRKSDLAGSQGSDRVEFFHWPLTADDTWTTRWDHQDLDIRVHSIDVAAGTARLMAHNATQMVYDYTYDADVGWFQSLSRFGPDATVAVSFNLHKSGHNWTGEFATWDLDFVIGLAGPLGEPPPPTQVYEVPLTATDVWVHASLHCTSGVAQVGTSPFPFGLSITGQDERGGGASGQPCPSDEEFSGSAGAPKAPAQGGDTETWGYSVAGEPGTGTYSLEIMVRTLTMTPFGA